MTTTHHKGPEPTKETIWAYQALDLPFGESLDAVSRRLTSYLEKCRPDTHFQDPDKFEAALELARILNDAYQKIKTAWNLHQETGPVDTPLPYSRELAMAYEALDLKFGRPLPEVTRQWRRYLQKCHPDRHFNNPEKLELANQLTRILTDAHEKIRKAWEQYGQG